MTGPSARSRDGVAVPEHDVGKWEHLQRTGSQGVVTFSTRTVREENALAEGGPQLRGSKRCVHSAQRLHDERQNPATSGEFHAMSGIRPIGASTMSG